MRVSLVLQLVPAVMCFIAACIIYRQNLAGSVMTGWRCHLAASIPAIYTFILLLGWVQPIQFFLIYTLDAKAWFPGVGLTLLGVVLGACLPGGYFRLRRVETNGRIYAALGVRRFRNIVAYGDPMVRLMRRIDPESFTRLKRSTLADRQTGHKEAREDPLGATAWHDPCRSVGGDAD